eukprot:9665520-Ditylum_brightwellii.AAC.1
MSAAVVMETSLDTLSLCAGVRHRHRMPGYEDKGNGSTLILYDADIAAEHNGIGGLEADFLTLTNSEDDMEDFYLVLGIDI